MGRHRNAWTLFFFLVLLVLALLVLCGEGEARKWTVDDDGEADFTSIQDAINASADGDVIEVMEGEYRGALEINKTLCLKAAEGRRVSIVPQHYRRLPYEGFSLINISAEGVIFDGFNLDYGDFDKEGFTIQVMADNCQIINNKFDIDSFADLALVHARKTVIEDNRFGSDSENNIFLNHSHGSIIKENDFSYFWEAYYAIHALNSCDNLVENNSFEDQRIYSILLKEHSNRNLLRNNSFGYDADVAIFDSSHNVIENNSFLEMKDPTINLGSATESVLRNNSYRKAGIRIWGDELSHWNTHHIDGTNIVSGKPIGYYCNLIGVEVPQNLGQLILANCSKLTIRDQKSEDHYAFLQMGFCNENLIENLSFLEGRYGIYLQSSHNNSFVKINGSATYGIYIKESMGNTLTNLNLENCSTALRLNNATENMVRNSNLKSNYQGALLEEGSHNNTFQNLSVVHGGSGFENKQSNYTRFLDLFISNNSNSGLLLSESTNIKLNGTQFQDSLLILEGVNREYWDSHTISEGNQLNGKPIYYYSQCTELQVPTDGAVVILADCEDITVNQIQGTSTSIYAVFSRNLSIKDCYLDSGYNSLYLLNNSHIAITNVSVIDSQNTGFIALSSDNISVNQFLASDSAGYGIWVSDSENITIFDTQILDSKGRGYGNGIVFSNSHDNEIIECNISRSHSGILFIYTNKTTVKSCELTASDQKNLVWLYRSHDNLISSNYGLWGDIQLYESHSNQIKKNFMFKSYDGIYLVDSDHNEISHNVLNVSLDTGFTLKGGNGNLLLNNSCTRSDNGISLYKTTNATLVSNRLQDGDLQLYGETPEHWNSHNLGITNTIRGNPIYYLVNERNIVVPQDGSQLFLVNCTDVTVTGQNITNYATGIVVVMSRNIILTQNLLAKCGHGIYFIMVENSSVFNNSFVGNSFGVHLIESMNCDIIENSFEDDFQPIFADNSLEITVRRNRVEKTLFSASIITSAIGLLRTNECVLRDNEILRSNTGIELRDSSRNIISGNLFMNCSDGIYLYDSHHCSIFNNTIISINHTGLCFGSSSNNSADNNIITLSGTAVRTYGSASNNTLFNNDIYLNTEAVSVSKYFIYSLDASRNWWGSKTGPYHQEENRGGKGDPISDQVIFKPWSKTRNLDPPEGDQWLGEPEEDEVEPTPSTGCYSLGFVIILILAFLAGVVKSKRWDPPSQAKKETKDGSWQLPSDYWKNNCLHCGAALRSPENRNPSEDCPSCGKTIDQK